MVGPGLPYPWMHDFGPSPNPFFYQTSPVSTTPRELCTTYLSSPCSLYYKPNITPFGRGLPTCGGHLRECGCGYSGIYPSGSPVGSCVVLPGYRDDIEPRPDPEVPKAGEPMIKETSRVSSIASLRLRAKEHEMSILSCYNTS